MRGAAAAAVAIEAAVPSQSFTIKLLLESEEEPVVQIVRAKVSEQFGGFCWWNPGTVPGGAARATSFWRSGRFYFTVASARHAQCHISSLAKKIVRSKQLAAQQQQQQWQHYRKLEMMEIQRWRTWCRPVKKRNRFGSFSVGLKIKLLFVLIPVSEAYTQQKLLKLTLKLSDLLFIAVNCYLLINLCFYFLFIYLFTY